MFKLIFKIIKWLILILIVAFLLVFPLFVFDENPFTFYWDALKVIWELFKNSNSWDGLWDLIKSKF